LKIVIKPLFLIIVLLVSSIFVFPTVASSNEGQQWVGLTDYAKQAVVMISHNNANEVIGAGFIVSPDGYVITNAHVVSNSNNLSAKLYNGNLYPAEVIHIDNHLDLALLKIPVINLPTLRFSDTESLKAGEAVIAAYIITRFIRVLWGLRLNICTPISILWRSTTTTLMEPYPFPGITKNILIYPVFTHFGYIKYC